MTANDILLLWEDHGFADSTTVRKEEVLNSAVAELLSDGPWVFQQAEATMAISTRTPTLPVDFHIAYSIVIPSLPVSLVPTDWDWISKTAGDLATVGQPIYYYFIGNQLNVYPVPDSSYSSRIMYIKNQPVLTSASVESDILVPPKFHRMIAYKGLEMLYSMEDDPDLATIFGGFYDRGVYKMKNDLSVKQLDRPSRMYDVADSDYYGDF